MPDISSIRFAGDTAALPECIPKGAARGRGKEGVEVLKSVRDRRLPPAEGCLDRGRERLTFEMEMSGELIRS
jgi:hypothetical protein